MKRIDSRMRDWVSVLAVGVLCATIVVTTAIPAGADTVNIEKTSFKGWDECYRITNGDVEMVVVAEIGPRVLYFAKKGKGNILYVDEKTVGQTGGDEWVAYGGHRLWRAPEDPIGTYLPDNIPVRAEVKGNTLSLVAAPEVVDVELRNELGTQEAIEAKLEDYNFHGALELRKEMHISMDEDGLVTLTHKLTNCGVKTLEIAPWVLTVMNQGGVGIFSNAPYAPHGPGHFLPVRSLSLWSYTDLTDPRLKFMDKYIAVQQDPNNSVKFKLGFSYTGGWAGYALKDQLFVKYVAYHDESTYPDFGCSVEIFTNEEIFEIESIGPMVKLTPEKSVTHVEKWKIFDIAPISAVEADVDKIVKAAGLD